MRHYRLCQMGLFFLLSSIAPLAFAECVLPPAMAKQVELSQKLQGGVDAAIEKALAEADIPACLVTAKAEFQQVAKSNDDETAHLAAGMISVLTAREAMLRGEAAIAISTLRDVAANYREFPVYLRAVQDLAVLLESRPTAPEWQFLSAQLDKIAASEDVSGLAAMAMSHLAKHQISTGHQEDGLKTMENYLAKPHSVQLRLISSILYLELLLEAGHRADVAVLAHSIEREVGVSLLDTAMRIRFLQVCVTAYSSPDEPKNRSWYERYHAALDEAQKELR